MTTPTLRVPKNSPPPNVGVVRAEACRRGGGDEVGVRVAEPRAKFDRLRARYVEAAARLDEADVEFAGRYGARYATTWLSRRDQQRLERLRAARRKAEEAIFAHVQAHSPRDWGRGVPQAWVCASLTWDDAVRPLGEPLSVVPPMSYGATAPKT